ncbi:DUF2585 domain-containing protein [soil metagenome]
MINKIRTFRLSTQGYVLLALGILVGAAVIELMMGRVPICTCGYIKFWEGAINSSGNSQHLTDFYTFSHIIHGFVFYGVLWLLRKRLPLRFRFLIALLIEVGWEILENTPMVINHYRSTTISLDYYGDSVLNSISDILSMTLGFVLAMRMPVWVTIGLIIIMEITVGYLIRDNLTLNIIMLLYPLESIKTWQMGG